VTIADRWKDSFLSQDRSRDASYFNGSRVQIEDNSTGVLTARVRGTYRRSYDVELDVDSPESGGSFSCTCPRFQEGYNCKHIWATILARDARQGDRAQVQSKRIKTRQKGKKVKTKPPKSMPWQKHLHGLFRRLSDDTDALAPTVAEKVTNRATRHWFVICLADQVGESALVLRLFQSTLKMDRQWGKPQRRGISESETDSLADETEREIFSQLRPGLETDGYQSYRRPYSSFRTGISTFTTPPALQGRVFSLLASTNRFVWTRDSDRHLDDAERLASQEGCAWALRVELRKVRVGRKQQLEVSPQFNRVKKTQDIANVVFAFGDGLVIFPDRLARLRPEDAEWIEAWQNTGPIQFAKQDLDSFLNDVSKLPMFPISCSMTNLKSKRFPASRIPSL